MANEALLIYKKLTLSEESTFGAGTITPGTKLLALTDKGIVAGLAQKIIAPKRISGRASQKSASLGTLAPKYSIPAYMYPSGLAPLLVKMAIGQVVDTEVASFTVSTGVNDTIDFNIGASNLVATVAAGTYPMGLSQADAGSTLCKAIYTAIHAAEGSGTYTVTYVPATGILTIARSTGTFQMKFATGPNTAKTIAPLIGFPVADQTGATSYASGATIPVFDHVLQPLDAIPYGLSKGLTAQVGLASGKVYDILDGVVDSMKLSYKPNEELMLDAVVEARKIANSSANLSALTEETTAPFLYSQLAFTYGGVSVNLKELEIDFANDFKKDLYVNSQYRSRFPRNGFRAVKGKFTLDLADSVAFGIYDSFIAGTQPALQAVWTQSANSIKTGFAYTLTALLNLVQYDLSAVPGGGGAPAPDAPIPFMALDDGTNGELKITIRNSAPTI